MGMDNWARNEVKLACKKERQNAKKDGDLNQADYGCLCYESALKAYESLLGDGHSGMSISITKIILNRLIDGRPLTPIEDNPKEWNFIHTEKMLDGHIDEYQSKRMSSLFKRVNSKDGSVQYSDIDRYYCKTIDNPTIPYTNSFFTKLLNELYPITMPYYPAGTYILTTEELLTDRKNGDFDSMALIFITDPEGNRKEVNRYFKPGPINGWIEIDLTEWNKRKKKHLARIKKENKNE